MEFCQVCENMLYVKLASDDDATLSYYCRKCGNEEASGAGSATCAYRVVLKRNDAASLQPVNEHTRHDPTLPVARDMPCPTPGCAVADSVRYIRYDDVAMKYIYLCTECGRTWTMDSQQTGVSQ